MSGLLHLLWYLHPVQLPKQSSQGKQLSRLLDAECAWGFHLCLRAAERMTERCAQIKEKSERGWGVSRILRWWLTGGTTLCPLSIYLAFPDVHTKQMGGSGDGSIVLDIWRSPIQMKASKYFFQLSRTRRKTLVITRLSDSLPCLVKLCIEVFWELLKSIGR